MRKQMVQNKYEEYDKKYIALQKAWDKNWEAQRNLGYVELDKPRPHGWDILIIPREDVQNREDAHVFWDVLKACAKKGHIRVKSWYKSKHKKYQTYPFRPYLKYLTKEEYQKLTPAVQKHFHFRPKGSYYGSHKLNFDFYICSVPNFYWVTKLVRSYITKVKVIDEILLQEEAEIKKELYFMEYERGQSFSKRRSRRKTRYNRSTRRTNNKEVKYHVKNESFEDYLNPPKKDCIYNY